MGVFQTEFGGFKFWAQSITGPDSRRIVKHPSWGRTGLSTEDTGSDGRHERIVATLTEAEYATLRTLVHTAKVHQFSGAFGSFSARGNITSRERFEDDEKVRVELEFIEDTSQPLLSPFDDESPDSKKNAAQTNFDDTNEEMSSTPGDTTSQVIYAEYSNAWTDYDNAITGYDEGNRDWQDVEGTLGELKEKGWAVIDNLRNFDSLQEGAYRVNSLIIRTLNKAHEYVKSIREQGISWFILEIKAPQDVYGLCLDVYGDTKFAEQIISRNSLLDPFYIDIGTQLEMPIDV